MAVYLSGRFLKALMLLFLLVSGESVDGCGPGRGGGRRRRPRKLTPLVFKQHVPNVSENTLGASGLTEGRIDRDDSRFKELVPNYNADIIFKDEEGTGADRLMTQRCKEKLNTLAISVMNQWPGVKLRVTEGWDEEGHHSPDSLHYEGRAVDITTSDRDRSKYGMLARLAVEAGFDWVYYESRSHIHCSVKSESSQAAKSGGCFDGNSTVITEDGGRRKMSELAVGDKVLSMDQSGNLQYSEVLIFLDRDSESRGLFYTIETEFGHRITLTPSHLVYVATRAPDQNEQLVHPKPSRQSVEMDNNRAWSSATNWSVASAFVVVQTTFAKNIVPGNLLITIDNEGDHQFVSLKRVSKVTTEMRTGVYAPLTRSGNLVVGDIVASCYAVLDNQQIAHFVFIPVRLYYNVKEVFVHLLQKMNVLRLSEGHDVTTQEQVGIHWYAQLLYSIGKIVIPTQLMYE